MKYPIISKRDPFLVIHVKDILLSDITTIGDTLLYVKRVGERVEFAEYAPIEEQANKLTFAVDTVFLDKLGGRYVGRLVYKGTELGEVEFIYDKAEAVLVGE